MPKNKVEVSQSGTRDEITRLFRKFQTQSVLEYVNSLSVDLLKNVDKRPLEVHQYQVFNPTTNQVKTVDAYILPWRLTDVAYYAIFDSNDFRGSQVDNKSYFRLSALSSRPQNIVLSCDSN